MAKRTDSDPAQFVTWMNLIVQKYIEVSRRKLKNKSKSNGNSRKWREELRICQKKGLVNTTVVLFESWPEALLTSPIANFLLKILTSPQKLKSTLFPRRRRHGYCHRLPFLGPHCHCHCKLSTFSQFLTPSSIFSHHSSLRCTLLTLISWFSDWVSTGFLYNHSSSQVWQSHWFRWYLFPFFLNNLNSCFRGIGGRENGWNSFHWRFRF